MKNIYFLAGLMIFNVIMYGQQEPVQTHYSINPYLYNPARAGEDAYLNVNLHYRKQWADFPDAPDTKWLAVDGALKNGKIGLGGQVFLDQAHIVQRFGAMATYAYHIHFKKKSDHSLSFGLSGGFIRQQINFKQAQIAHPDDPLVFPNGAVKTTLNMSAGFNYHIKGFNIGASIPQLAMNEMKYEDDQNEFSYSLRQHYYGFASYKLDMGASKNFYMEPIVMTRYLVHVPFQFDAQLLMGYKEFLWFGGGYRFDNRGIIGLAGFRVHDAISVSYSWEQSTDSYQGQFGHTHEFTVGVRFKTDKYKKQIEQLEEDVQEHEGEIDSLGTELSNTQEKLDSMELAYDSHLKKIDTVLVRSNTKWEKITSVYFEFDSDEISEKELSKLSSVNEMMADEDVVRIEITGNASYEGSNEYNLVLSDKRIISIKNKLIEMGIKESLLFPIPYGEENPFGRPESDPDDVKKDRRVDIYILSR